MKNNVISLKNPIIYWGLKGIYSLFALSGCVVMLTGLFRFLGFRTDKTPLMFIIGLFLMMIDALIVNITYPILIEKGMGREFYEASQKKEDIEKKRKIVDENKDVMENYSRYKQEVEEYDKENIVLIEC